MSPTRRPSLGLVQRSLRLAGRGVLLLSSDRSGAADGLWGFESHRGTHKYRCPAWQYPGIRRARRDPCEVRSGLQVKMAEDPGVLVPFPVARPAGRCSTLGTVGLSGSTAVWTYPSGSSGTRSGAYRRGRCRWGWQWSDGVDNPRANPGEVVGSDAQPGVGGIESRRCN